MKEVQLSTRFLENSDIWLNLMENGRARPLESDERVYLQRLNVRVSTSALTRYNFSVSPLEREALLGYLEG